MKKSTVIAVAVVCALVILSSVLFSGGSVKTVAAANTVAVRESAEEIALLNILNDNFVYGSDFEDVDDIVNCSVNKFKTYVSDEGYISDSLVCDFVYDMYGIEILDMSQLNPEHTFKPGYVYALAGFTEYEHKNIRISENEDGTITARTDISVKSLDGNAQNYKAETLFVKNDASRLGYNIVYSEIYTDKSSV